jgi:hypothetical protein
MQSESSSIGQQEEDLRNNLNTMMYPSSTCFFTHPSSIASKRQPGIRSLLFKELAKLNTVLAWVRSIRKFLIVTGEGVNVQSLALTPTSPHNVLPRFSSVVISL